MDRSLLDVFTKCVKNNEAYYKKFITHSGDYLLVVKYQYIPTFTIKHIDMTNKQLKNNYDNLYPFDCFNMIEELIII